MEILIDKKRLENIALIVSNYVEKKDNTSLNSNILLLASNNELILRASDSEIGIEYKIPDCNIISEGTIFLNAKKLIDILKSLNNDNIKIKKLEKSIKITQNKTNFSLPIANENNFSFLEDENSKTPILISSKELNIGFKMILPAIDNNGISFQFNCCYIDILRDSIVFVGSDSKRIHRYSFIAQNENEQRIIITKKSAQELQKLLNEEVRVYKTNNYLIIENDNFKFFTKLVTIDFLKYVEVMPHKLPTNEVVIKTEEFLNEIKKLSSVCTKCQIEFETGKITFKNNIISDDINETNATSELEANIVVDEKFEINLTNRHIMDFLHLNENEDFTFKFYSSSAPVILESKNFLSLISANKN
ncbi:DNA polymerase III subunit beta [Campylobacter sp. Cr9]|uniref:DNA polymerase III subunit beta n=1 Tax=Campylobacter sp. Cr9 TaxID=2735728 RepID=UPI0030144C1D|nr:DNA polymerase III subunit beta [Campylobacter sp. Cr9]